MFADKPKRSQMDKFKETARKLEADEDERAFEAWLKRLAKPKLKLKPKEETPDK